MAKPRRRWRVPLPYCPLPLAYIEVWMPFIGPGAHLVMTVLIRATWGHQKDSDVLAHAELRRRTGLPDKSLRRGINILRDNGLIRTDGPPRHAQTFTINWDRFLQKPGTVYLTAPNVLVMRSVGPM